MFIYFEDNAGVIVNPKGEMKGQLCSCQSYLIEQYSMSLRQHATHNVVWGTTACMHVCNSTLMVMHPLSCQSAQACSEHVSA